MTSRKGWDKESYFTRAIHVISAGIAFFIASLLSLFRLSFWGKIQQTKDTEKQHTPPQKPYNAQRRPREYLTPAEVNRLIQAAQQTGRHAHRNATLILIAYRHGLRVSELTALQWGQVDFEAGLLHVTRNKRGIPSTQPLQALCIGALRKLKTDYAKSPYVFVSDTGKPISRWTVGKIVAQAGQLAELGMPIHPHMLRHATGFKLANDGQDTRSIQLYLGHRNIQHTVRYTELAPERFKSFWQD